MHMYLIYELSICTTYVHICRQMDLNLHACINNPLHLQNLLLVSMDFILRLAKVRLGLILSNLCWSSGKSAMMRSTLSVVPFRLLDVTSDLLTTAWLRLSGVPIDPAHYNEHSCVKLSFLVFFFSKLNSLPMKHSCKYNYHTVKIFQSFVLVKPGSNIFFNAITMFVV